MSSGSRTQTIKVVQEAGYFLIPEQYEYTIGTDGGNLEIYFSTNVDADELSVFSSIGLDSWLTQTQSSRTKALTDTVVYVIPLTVAPNEQQQSRTASLYFFFTRTNDTTESSELLATVVIIQEGLATGGVSTDYSEDKTVRTLQEATIGQGIPIVLMGDGFKDTDIAAGTYDQVMDKTYENLFTEEPLQSLREYFNVYAVTAVSANNQFGSGYETAFSCELEGGNSTGISGDNYAVREYVACVDGIELDNTLAVVILNTPVYAGTTYFGYFNPATWEITDFAIAYCPVIYDIENESFRQVLVHEAVGHGFAKLWDEYSYESYGTIPTSEVNSIKSTQTLYGWAQNVDFTDDSDEILWSTFLSDSRYSSEVGIYEGAATYPKGAYRPSEESMMNSNINGFNAPSRQAIYNKVMKHGEGREADFEEFADFDQQTATYAASRAAVRATVSPYIGKPLPTPRFVNIPLPTSRP